MTYSYDSPVTCNAGLLGPSLADINCSASTFVIFMSLLDAFIRSEQKISGICERVESVDPSDDAEYDFVVVGGGAAGSVLASRLSENPEWKILLLEAGPDEPTGSQVPSFVGQFLRTELDWNYTTINESYGCLSTNGTCSWPAGKNLGGNTAHSGSLYMRGNPTDYENWAALGNEGWTWDEVKPYFLKSEDNGEIDRVGRTHHGTGGPLPIARFPFLPTLGNSILAAATESGYGVTEDLNGDTITGFSLAQFANKNGIRCSSSRAFLWPVRDRENLHVSLNSFVTRVLIKDKSAIGVEYYKDDVLKTVYVTKEVIVSGGAIRSPHILLHSGIGPKDHLESVGIEVIEDLPGVGKNIQNHVTYIMSFTVNDTDTYDNNWAAVAEYLAFQTGPMSSGGLSQVVGALSSDLTEPDFPDLLIYATGYRADCAPGEIDALRSTGRRTIFMWSTYLHAKSRGRISLASNDPFDYPVIWANYLSDENDVEGLVQGINIIMKMSQTEALRAHDLTLSMQQIDACSEYDFPSDEYWACAVRQDTYPENHQAGSCKMGPISDPLAVVDNELRVHGIKGLRVADASIMPQVTSGSPGAPTIMIAERAADFIKNTKC